MQYPGMSGKVLVLAGLLVFCFLRFAVAGEMVNSRKSGGDKSTGENACTGNFFSCAPDDAKDSSCGILNNSGLSSASPASLGICLKSLQSKLTGSLETKKKAAKELSSIREKAFLGFALTCYGEAPKTGGSSIDRMAIMKVLDNRTQKCKEQMPDKEFTPMDIALQEKQFSMYNSDIYKVPGAFEAALTDKAMSACVDAFKEYSASKKDEWKPEEKEVYHYFATKAPAMPPEWSSKASQVLLSLNGQKTSPSIHTFEANPWDCKPYANN